MTAETPELHHVITFIDLISPVASEGTRFILTVCDYITKWANAVGT